MAAATEYADAEYLPPAIRSAMEPAFVESLKVFFLRNPKPSGPNKTELGAKLREILSHVKEHIDPNDAEKKDVIPNWIRICKADLNRTYNAMGRMLAQEDAESHATGQADATAESADGQTAGTQAEDTEAPQSEKKNSAEESSEEADPKPAAAAAAKGTGILASVANLFRAKPKEPVMSPLQMLLAAGPSPSTSRKGAATTERVTVDSDNEEQPAAAESAAPTPLQMLMGASKPATATRSGGSKKRPATYNSDEDNADDLAEREELSAMLGIPSGPRRQRPRVAAAAM